jgi:hypothetical protein
MSKAATLTVFAVLAGLVVLPTAAHASSHREAPFITRLPKLDSSDFYLFNSYESGRTGYVTMIANYLPLQDAYGGPNYFQLDPAARYNLNIDNNGDGQADLTFRFHFENTRRDIAVPVGPEGMTRNVAIPLINAGQIVAGNNAALNVLETYTVEVVRPGRPSQLLRNQTNGSTLFTKPVDNIGNKSLPDYAGYAAQYVYNVVIPGCSAPGRLFVGQRKDSFVVNLGEVFDLVNVTNPLGPVDAEADDLADKNVTSLILEAPASCLTAGTDPVIGAWTSAEEPVGPGERRFVQRSRLANPLFNELVIGLKDKDTYNATPPAEDARFGEYVDFPTVPALLEILFGAAGVKAPTAFPRTDLRAVFLSGIAGLNQPQTLARPAEVMRLNTSIPPKSAAQQSNLGALAGDLAGYPNGRRPGDDVVDITLRAAMGALLPPEQAPSGNLPFTDGAVVSAAFFDERFPYLKTPIPGSPNATP